MTSSSTTNFGNTKAEKSAYVAQLVQYGSNFSNTENMRRLQTARPKSSAPGTKVSSEIVSAELESQIKNGLGAGIKISIPNTASKEEMNQVPSLTSKALAYVQAMTHPPLLLLSPLPPIEEGVLLFPVDPSSELGEKNGLGKRQIIEQEATVEDVLHRDKASTLMREDSGGPVRQKRERAEVPAGDKGSSSPQRPAKRKKASTSPDERLAGDGPSSLPLLGTNEGKPDVLLPKHDRRHEALPHPQSKKVSKSEDASLRAERPARDKGDGKESRGTKRQQRDEDNLRDHRDRNKSTGNEGRARSRSRSRSRSGSTTDSKGGIDIEQGRKKERGDNPDQCKYKPNEKTKDTSKYKDSSREREKERGRNRDGDGENMRDKERDKERNKHADTGRTTKGRDRDKSKDNHSRSDSKSSTSPTRKKGRATLREKVSSADRNNSEIHTVSAAKLKEEATKLKHLADAEIKHNKAEGLNYYIFAGLKFLECCNEMEREAEGKHDGLKAAVVMYRETAKFFDNCGVMCLSSKEQQRASLCYKCMAVALGRSFNLQKEKLKRTRDEIWNHLNKGSHSSSPVSGNMASGGRASSMSPSPTYRSIPSPSSAGGSAAGTASPALLQQQLFFLAEVDDVFKALEAWHKAETNCTGRLAEVELPFTLDDFLTTVTTPPVAAVVAYVRKALELL